MPRRFIWLEIGLFLLLFYFTFCDGFRLNYLAYLSLASFVVHCAAEVAIPVVKNNAVQMKKISGKSRGFAWIVLALLFIMSCVGAAQT